MFPLRSILLPVDFSGRARQAAGYARLLALRSNARVSLLHALPLPHYEFGTAMMGDLLRTRTNLAQEELNKFAATEFPDLEVTRLALVSDAATAIVDFAHRENTGLIVMPTHGYGKFRRFLLGSTTVKVLHDAECPVLTGVHMEQAAGRREPEFGTVVCALDLGPHSAGVLRAGAGLAREFGARLFLIHAIPSLPAHETSAASSGWQSSLASTAGEQIRQLQEEAGTNAMPIITGGSPAEAICRQAGDLKADLLVIGRGGSRDRFGRLRATAYTMIRGCLCPVLSV